MSVVLDFEPRRGSLSSVSTANSRNRVESRSIQYSAYSSDSEGRPDIVLPSPQPHSDCLSTEDEYQSDESSSSSSFSFSAAQRQLVQKRGAVKRRTSQLIRSKMDCFESTLHQKTAVSMRATMKNNGDSFSKKSSRRAKKSKLASKWRKLVNAQTPQSTFASSIQQSDTPLTPNSPFASMPFRSEEASHHQESESNLQRGFAEELRRQHLEELKEEESRDADDEEAHHQVLDGEYMRKWLATHFVFDATSILHSRYILQFLKDTEKVTVRGDDHGNDTDDCSLQKAAVECFGEKVLSVWGYHLRVL